MSTELHTLSGAFALDAVSAEEAAQFRTHLEQCAACRDEVRELREAAARMGEVESQLPPPALKARVLAAADRMPQQPPKVPFGRSGKEGKEGARRRWAPRLAAAAAAAVIAVGGGVGISQLGNDDTGTATLAAPVAQVFDADDVRLGEVRTSHGPLRVATSAERGEMAVDTSGLQTLDSRHVYQLWTIEDGTPESVGVLDRPAEGASMAMPGAGAEVAITVEPAGGSDQPTTDPIAQLDPASV